MVTFLSPSDLGKTASKYMSQGKLLPDKIITDMMLAEVNSIRQTNILLDGFPRTIEQANSLEKVLKIDCVLNLDVPFEEIINRVKCRWIHQPSGRIYNDEFKPPKKKVSRV